MPALGTKKINQMLILDYADGRSPNRVFRAEIDIPLGSARNYATLQALLEGPQTKETRQKIVNFLLRKLGTLSSEASRLEKRQHPAARHFIAAAFDSEPPPERKRT